MRHDYLVEVAESLKGFNDGTKNYKAHVDVTIEHLTRVRTKVDESIRQLEAVSAGLSKVGADIGPSIKPESPANLQGALKKTAEGSPNKDQDTLEEDLEGALNNGQKGNVG